MGDEEHAPLDLPARHGLGDVVQEADDAESLAPLLADPNLNPALKKLLLHSPDGLKDVLEDVEVVEGSLPLIQGEPKLRYLVDERFRIEGGTQRLVDGHAFGFQRRRCRRVAFLRLVLGL